MSKAGADSVEDQIKIVSSDDSGNVASQLQAGSVPSTALRRALPEDQARAQFMNAIRREMYDALALFHAHVKGAISLMFGLITAVFAVVGFVITRDSPPQVLALVLNAAPVILVLIFPFSIVSVLVIGRYYRLYVAALIYAARLHEGEGIAGHQWFADVRALEAKLGSSVSDDALVRSRTYGWPHSWSLYALLILFIGVVSLGLAVLLWLEL